MVVTKINGVRHLKRKSNEQLTEEYKKKLLKKELVWSFYGTDYHYYRILK